jgi:uracil-DNA glycosylase family 4
MDPKLRRIVLQHAETSRLMGVDFVPAYGDNAANEYVSVAESEPEPEPLPEVVTVRQPAPATPVRVSDPVPPKPAAPAPGIPGLSTIAPASRAAEKVQAALDALRARYEADAPHKQFVTAHSTIVFGEGDPCARLMFIGEAPGAEEDRTGRPFVGRAGQLLEKMIGAMGLKREQVYIANVLKTRPPDNATPTTDEIRICAPYLYHQVGIVRPEVIVTLGLPATRAMLDTVDSMSRLRGRWASFRPPAPCDGDIAVMPTYHPAFLLRSYTPENRAKVWSDLQMVMDRLGIKGSGKAPA